MDIGVPGFILRHMIFQVRYRLGYRYLDVCGKILVDIERAAPVWEAKGVSTQSGVMVNKSHPIEIAFGSDSASVTQGGPRIKSDDEFVKAAHAILPMAIQQIEPGDYERIGVRFFDVCAVKSPSHALRRMQSDYLGTGTADPQGLFGKQFISRQVVMRAEDPEWGARLRVAPVKCQGDQFNDDILLSDLSQPASPSPALLQSYGPGISGYFIHVDLDYYRWRPEKTVNFADFIHEGIRKRGEILPKLFVEGE